MESLANTHSLIKELEQDSQLTTHATLTSNIVTSTNMVDFSTQLEDKNDIQSKSNFLIKAESVAGTQPDFDVGEVPIKKKYTKVPLELKLLMVKDIESGDCTIPSASKIYNMPYKSVARVYNRYRTTGTLSKKRTKFREKRLNAEHVEFLKEKLCDNNACTMKELHTYLKERFDIEVGLTTIALTVKTFTGNIRRVPKTVRNTAKPDLVTKRKTYAEQFLRLTKNGRTIIFFEETGLIVDNQGQQMTSRRKTIMASMTHDELLHFKVVDGACNHNVLCDYLAELFAILSICGIEGATLIMSNAALNHSADVKDVIFVAGHHILYLSDASPFFNPVENVFAQFKSIVKAKGLKVEEDLESCIVCIRNVITRKQCKTYYRYVLENCVNCLSGKLIYNK